MGNVSQDLINIFDFEEPDLGEGWMLCRMERMLSLQDWLILLEILGDEDVDFSVRRHVVSEACRHRAWFLLSPGALDAYHRYTEALCKLVYHEAADFSTSTRIA
jgi:hypothetical protein